MDYTKLGSTELRISRVAFGCAPIGGHDYGHVDDQESERAILAAIDAGINVFDVADVYGLGHAEEVLGRALRGKRSEVVIATKVGVWFDDAGRTRKDLSPKWIRHALEASLRRLRTDWIDLYQVHWPDPLTPMEEWLEVLVEMQQLGRIRHVGLCNFPADNVRDVLERARVESVQTSYNLVDWKGAVDLRTLVTQRGLSAFCYNCLAQGALAGKYSGRQAFSGSDRRQRSGYFEGEVLEAILATVDRMRSRRERYARNPAQLAIRWVLDSWPETVALVGLKGAEQAHEAAGALGWLLDAQDVEFLRDGVGIHPTRT